MTQIDRDEILRKLEEKREKMGLSMERFANEVLDMSYQGYWRWQRQRFNPDLDTLEKLHDIVQNGSSEE